MATLKREIRLTRDQERSLKAAALATGKTETELIGEALERYLEQVDTRKKYDALMAGAGMWKDRTDLPDVRKMREEWDERVFPKGRKK